jgi:hypothetical protein
MELIMRNFVVAAVWTVSLSLASCARHDAPAPAPAADDAAAERLTLAERLTREASSRPAGALRAEDVAAALQRAGLGLAPMQQVLARTVGARFCMSARTEAGMGVAVCEFADDAEAARGLDYSRRTFDRLIPDRRLLRNHRTVLTLTGAQALDGQAARAAEAFASL